MGEEELNRICNELNELPDANNIIKVKLSERVERIVYFTPLENVLEQCDFRDVQYPEKFFAVLNENNTYVSLIQDGSVGLHWFTIKDFRCKGYVSEALKKVILPFIKTTQEKDTLCVSISEFGLSDENYIASTRVAVKCGFKKTSEDLYCLDLKSVDNYPGFEKVSESAILDESERRVIAASWHLEYLNRLLQEIDNYKGLKDAVSTTFSECLESLSEVRDAKRKGKD